MVERIVFGSSAGGEARRFRSGERLESDLLPGLELGVEQLFEER
jgi:hypothetical protein